MQKYLHSCLAASKTVVATTCSGVDIETAHAACSQDQGACKAMLGGSHHNLGSKELSKCHVAFCYSRFACWRGS